MQALCSTLLLAPWQHPGGWSGCGKTVTQDKRRRKRGRKEGKKREKSQREGQVPATPVKHFLWILSSRKASHQLGGWWEAFGAFQLTEVIVDEGSSCSHLKTVTIHSTLPVTSGHHCLACVSAYMCLCCYNTGKGTAQFPLSACQSFLLCFLEGKAQVDSYTGECTSGLLLLWMQ